MTRNATRFPNGHDPALNTAFHTHRLGGRMEIPPAVEANQRLLREWVRQVLQVEAVIDGPWTHANAHELESTRASCNCVCDQCGMKYADHPACVWEPSLTILCSTERVKL